MEYIDNILNNDLKQHIEAITFNSNIPNLVIDIGKIIPGIEIFDKKINNQLYFKIQNNISKFIKKYDHIRSKHYFLNNLEYIIYNNKQVCIAHSERKTFDINFNNYNLRLKIISSNRVDNSHFSSIDKYHNIENRDIRVYKYFIQRENKFTKSEYININFIRSNNKYFNINISTTCSDTNFKDVIRTIKYIIKIMFSEHDFIHHKQNTTHQRSKK